MSFVENAARRSPRLFAVIVLIAVISTSGLASRWDGVRSFAESVGAVFGFAPSSEITAAENNFKPEPLMTLGSCDTAGPIEIESSGGTFAPTAYPTLTAAFAAINAGTHTGGISIEVCGNTNEGTGTALLNASGTGAASYAQIIIKPVGGAARTITGATTAGQPMIDFSGADNVTVDGLNTGGNSLTISNTTASGTNGTATIRFIDGATGNTITNSTILGSGFASTFSNGGTIYFSTDGVTANGNDNITISNNDIGPAGANLPTKGFFCSGSTATTAVGNSGFVIDNNNIFDYFAANTTSSGLVSSGGCNTFSVTNNRFYQTAPRTWTSSLTHRAIDIGNNNPTSGAQGITITGNIIGYASKTQTGTYALSGGGGKFQGIFFNGISGGTPSTINDNTVANVSVTGVTSSGTSSVSPLIGIIIFNGPVTSNNNTIGSQSATGSLVLSTNTGSTVDVYGIYNFSSDNCTSNGNNVGGISVANAGTGAVSVYGIRIFTSQTASWAAASNNIGGTVADSIQLNAAGAASQVIGMLTSNAAGNLSLNTIRNLTTNAGTGTGTGASLIGISVAAAASNHTLTKNTIFNLKNTDPTGASTITGIQFGGNNASIVERNLIYGLSAATDSTAAEVNGIRVGGGTTVYRNNMIAIGAGIPNAIGPASTTGGINGIYEPTGGLSFNSFYHNSVYIGGAPTAGTGASFAFISTQATNTRSYRDNIFVNARGNAGASGKNYIIGVAGTTPNPAGLTINNNVYFSSGAGAVFGFFNALDVADLNAWKTAVGQDANSFFADPKFVAPTAATPDLHINPAILTVVEGSGADVGVTNDFDNDTRASLTPVDIGADAGNFIGADLQGPTITYAALGNTTSTADRTLTISATDTAGVPTTGTGRPVLYFRKGTSGAYAASQCAFTSGSNFDCPFAYASVGGVVGGETIQYFVAAQDTPGNVAVNPSAGAGGLTANPPAAATPPTAPNSYQITGLFSGSYNVGTGQAVTSLTNPGGLFELLNAGTLTGSVTINITSDLTGETGTVALNQLTESPAGSNFTVTIKPSGAARTISGTGTGLNLIKLNGADRVTIDGSLSGGTDRSLTLVNGNPADSTSVIFIASLGAGQGATNVTIKNSIIRAGSIGTIASFTLGIFAGNTSGAVAGPDNDNLVIQNNKIERARTGMQIGSDATGVLDGLQVTGNTIGDDVAANSIGRFGVFVSFANGATITGNTIKNVFLTGDSLNPNGISVTNLTGSPNPTVIASNTITGISGNGSILTPTGISASSSSGVSITQNTIDGVTNSGNGSPRGLFIGTNLINSSITRNTITNVAYTGTGGFGGKGIDVITANAASNLLIANNSISNIKGDGWNGFNSDAIVGLRLLGTTGGVNVYNNSVCLCSGAFAGNTSGTRSAAFYIDSNVTNLDIRNNIFATNLDNTAVTTDKTYALATGATSNALFTNINNNDYFASGTPAFVGLLSSVDRLTLANWQTATGQDANSLAADPVFASPTDLHITNTSPAFNTGATLAAVTNDIDGDPRPQGGVYDIGADEVTALPATNVQFSAATGSVGEGGGSINLTVTRTGLTTGSSSVSYQFTDGTATGGAACGAGVDYRNTGGTVFFNPGDTSQIVNVPVCDDALIEGGETFGAFLSGPSGATLGTPATETITITDNDFDTTAPALAYSPLPNIAGPPVASLPVTATDNVGVTGVTIAWSVNGGSAASAPCGFASGTAQNGVWNCQIAGIPALAAVSYSVTATDAAANSAANPAGGLTNLFTVGAATNVPAGIYDYMAVGGAATLSGPVTVNSALALNGTVATGPNTLTLGCAAAVTGAGGANYVIGTVEKQFCSTGAFTFPIGTTADGALTVEGPLAPQVSPPEYTPVDVNVTAVTLPVSLVATVSDTPLTGADPAQSATRFWDITKVGAGALTADLTFHYLDQDIVGSESGYKVLKRNAATVIYPGSTVNTAANTATAPGVTSFSQWGVGLLVPTAANAGIAGRVTTASGEGIRNATVMLTGGGLTEPRYVRTGSFGNYRFEDLAVGENYVVTVISKRFVFANPSRVISLTDNVGDADFTAEGQ